MPTSIFFDAYTRIGPRAFAHPKHPWSLEHLIAEMDHCSISGALVASIAQTTYDAMHENLKLTQRLAAFDYLFPLWNVHTHHAGDFPEPQELSTLLRKHDIRAVTIHPVTNNWSPTSRTSRDLFKALARDRTLVLVDARTIDARDVEPMLDENPTIPFLIRGFTWAQGRWFLPIIQSHANANIGFDFYQSNYAVEKLTAEGHEDKLVYCSNATEMAIGAHRFYVDYAQVPHAVKQKFAGGNLTRLLGGKAPPRERVNKNEDEIMTEARQGKPLSTLVIDMHAHILDEGLNGAGGGYGMYKGGPKGTIELAKAMGIDQMGVMSWNGPVSVHADEGNECVKACLDAYPDFYWGLATFDPVRDSAEVMTEKMKAIYADKRFLGLKPYPQYGVPYSDARYDCWWEFGNARKLYTGIHPTNWFQGAEFDHICKKAPELTVVAYHGGGDYKNADICIDIAKKHPNFMIEVTLTPVCAGIIDYLCAGAGADRVMYGSDLPMRDPRQQLGWCVYSRLPLADKKKVLGENAKKLIDRVRANQLANGAK